ncbi:MAG: gamma-glutamylcyclotransferase [Candidatus Lambdaproteobacteria bacterium]|nr:gamma-glutamylcyclotransferase [Candidatus Lambdaproteobacteria bacterium]
MTPPSPVHPASQGVRTPWIFGYGSLIWRPGFAFVERHPAVLAGWHRDFCRYSFHHRGTPARPGMVAGLSAGGACKGMAYRVAEPVLPGALAYLDRREGPGYVRRALAVGLEPEGEAGRRTVEAWVYVPDPAHASYAANLSRPRIVELIGTGIGASGTAHDYLRDLLRHLDELGTPDPLLEAVLRDVERYLRMAAERATGGVPLETPPTA